MNPLKRILLVEDHPLDLELALGALRQCQLASEVVVARDGEEALDYLFGRGGFETAKPVPPLVVFLDLKLPKVTGPEVLRSIRGDANLRQLPVVMLTSSREQSDLNHCYALGANAYIVKPMDLGKTTQAIMQLGMLWAVANEPPPSIQRLRA